MIRHLLLICGLIAALAVPEARAEERWQVLRGAEARLHWRAPGLQAQPEKAEAMASSIGYRVERYFWKAQETGGAFALAGLRDFTDSEHYIGGRVDLQKSAATLLKGLETPPLKPLDQADRVLFTGLGLASARRFSLGVRECLSLGLYAPSAEPAEPPSGKTKAEPMTEGNLRLDALYCAKAGKSLVLEDLPELAKSLGVKQTGEN